MSKPTCLIGGMFNYDTITWKEDRKAPEQVMAHEVGGTGGVVSKLLAVLGWHALPIGRFDDTEEGRLLKSGLADFGCDTRFVTNTPDGGTTLLTVCTTKVEGGPNKKAIRTSNAKDKARGVKSRFPRWTYIKIDQARALAAGLDFVPDVFFFDTPAPGHRELARILREKGTLVYFEPCNPKDPACMKSVELADVVKFSNEDFPDVSFVDRYPDKLFIQTLGGPDGARFRFPGKEWQTVPGFVNDNVLNPEGSGDWTTMGLLTTLWRNGGVRFAELTPERVASALSTGQWYASRNCSYITTCCDELLDELGVRGIVEKPLHTSARKYDIMQSVAESKMNTEQKVIEVVGGIIRRGDKYLLGRRPVGKSLGGHWEFIGGKIEPGETPCEALARECREEIALEIVNACVRTAVTHAYPDRTIHLTLIDCEPAPGAEPTALEHEALDWYSPAEMSTLDFCPADAELLPVVFGGAV